MRVPLVLDSPHSGVEFPADFNTCADEAALMSGWDAWIPDLWAGSVRAGATLIEAHCSRMVLDLNRAPDDIDDTLLEADWAGARPTRYSERGMGLLRRFALPGQPVHPQPLAHATVRGWIRDVYAPYHDELRNVLDALHARFGAVWHLNCHSMKSQGNSMNIDSGAGRADIVLGDLDGCSAEPAFVELVERLFGERGYAVARNRPYRGGYLIANYSDPAVGRHGLQVEINRALYMDESSRERTAGFDRLRRDLAQIADVLADYTRTACARRPA